MSGTGLTANQWDAIRDCIVHMTQEELEGEIQADTLRATLYTAVYGKSRVGQHLGREFVNEAVRLWGKLAGTEA